MQAKMITGRCQSQNTQTWKPVKTAVVDRFDHLLSEHVEQFR